jgi:hypothetical protein
MFQTPSSSLSSPFSYFYVFLSNRSEVLFARMFVELLTDNCASDKCCGMVDSDRTGLNGITTTAVIHGAFVT